MGGYRHQRIVVALCEVGMTACLERPDDMAAVEIQAVKTCIGVIMKPLSDVYMPVPHSR
jgi:hypothetical protein